MIKTKVIKKDNSIQEWDCCKIKNAIIKASNRCGSKDITNEELESVVHLVEDRLKDFNSISVLELHEVVMSSLFQVNHDVYTEYRAYRNYKDKFTKSFANTYEFANKVVSIGDTENSNKDSQLNSTKQALIASGIMRELETNFELKPEWVKAHKDGYIHIHDLSERFLRSQNCCLFDMKNVLRGGFELNGIKYSEPGGVQKAFDIASDVVLSASAQQYGK